MKRTRRSTPLPSQHHRLAGGSEPNPFLLASTKRGCGKGPAPSVDGKLAAGLFLEGQGVLHAAFSVTKCNSKIAFMCVFLYTSRKIDEVN